MKINDETRDYIAFCIRSSTVIFFLIAVVLRSTKLIANIFLYLSVMLGAIAIYDLFVCEAKIENRHLVQTIIFYLMMIVLAIVAHCVAV